MFTRRKALKFLGLGSLVGAPAAAAAYELPLALPFPPPPRQPLRYQPPPPSPIKVIASTLGDKDTRILTRDGRNIKFVTGVELQLGAHSTMARVKLEGLQMSVTGVRNVFQNPKDTFWWVDLVDGKPTCLDEEGKPVPNVRVVGWECEPLHLVRWTVICDCEVEWVKPERHPCINYPDE